jgi:hypothetical protein
MTMGRGTASSQARASISSASAGYSSSPSSTSGMACFAARCSASRSSTRLRPGPEGLFHPLHPPYLRPEAPQARGWRGVGARSKTGKNPASPVQHAVLTAYFYPPNSNPGRTLPARKKGGGGSVAALLRKAGVLSWPQPDRGHPSSGEASYSRASATGTAFFRRVITSSRSVP